MRDARTAGRAHKTKASQQLVINPRSPHLVASQATRLAKRRRGNPNWGKPMSESAIEPVELTEFEKLALRLKVPQPLWLHSRELRQFAKKHARTKYVPEDLLKEWGIDSGEMDV